MLRASLANARLWHSPLTYLALFFVLTIAWTWPLPTRLSTRIAHDAGDPVLNAWILWWNTQAPPLSDRWWNAPAFFPGSGSLALSEHLAGIALFTAPLHYAGLNAAAAYNVALIGSIWLSGFFAYLLGRSLSGSTFGGLVCGLAFAFAPYRAGQLAHLQVIASQWMPLALLALHRYVADSRRRWLALFAAAWILQALSNGYYLLFFPVLIAFWLLWFGNLRQRAFIAATFAASSLLLLPVLLRYREVHAAFDLKRSLGEMLVFRARWHSFIQAPDLLAFWPPFPGATPEGDLFPGLTVAVLLLVAAFTVLRRRAVGALAARGPLLFYCLAAALMYWLSFGPTPPDASGVAAVRPYNVLVWLPGFDGLRVPPRFAMIATLCVAAAAGIVAARIVAARTPVRAGAAGLIVCGILVDGWIEPMPLIPLPPRFRVPDAPNAIVLELPMHDPTINVAAMYRGIHHGRPVVNGYSGHNPPHYPILAAAIRRGDVSALEYLAAGRAVVVLVHRQDDAYAGWCQYVAEAGGTVVEETGPGTVFLVPPKPRERTPRTGAELPVASVNVQAGYATLDLGTERTVRSAVVRLEQRADDIGARTLVEVSLDGDRWEKAWYGATGGLAVAAIVEDPRDAPLRLVLPDVRARYVRVSPAAPWMRDAVRVYGPE